MAKNKYYAVSVGRNPGIYTSWPDAESQVKGFPGAIYKGFPDETSAKAFMQLAPDQAYQKPEPAPVQEPKQHAGRHVDIFVDGSYNPDTGDYGYGVYVDDPSDPRIFVGKGTCQAGGRNIEGEVAASEAALGYLLNSRKYDSATIHHDYEGIGRWAEGDWAAKKEYTARYASYVNHVRGMGIQLDFNHIDGHTGVKGNEYVDKLAKVGCGVWLRPSEKELLEQLRGVPGFPNTRGVPAYEAPAQDLDNSFSF